MVREWMLWGKTNRNREQTFKIISVTITAISEPFLNPGSFFGILTVRKVGCIRSEVGATRFWNQWKIFQIIFFRFRIEGLKIGLVRMNPSWPCGENLHVQTMHADKLFDKHGKYKELIWNFQTEDSYNIWNFSRIAFDMEDSFKSFKQSLTGERLCSHRNLCTPSP